MIRSFVALPVPDDVAGTLEAAQAGLRTGLPVPEENFHITLAFLGEQREDVLEDLHGELDAIRVPKLTLAVDGVDTFGGAEPRIAHARIAPDPDLARLRKAVARAARTCGIEGDGKPFKPHVTLVRFPRGGLTPEDAADLDAWLARRVGLTSEPFEVETFGLYRSTLTRNGPAYDLMAEYALGR